MQSYPRGQTFEGPAREELNRFLEEADRDRGSVAGSLEEFEEKLHKHVSKFEAEAVGQYLEHFDENAEGIEVEGVAYRKKMRCEQEYVCQAGPVRVERSLFVPEKGEGKAICPLEQRAGIMEGRWTPRAAKLMLRAVSATTPKEAEEFFGELGGMRPSKSSLDRLPKRASEVWERKRREFERELRQTETLMDEAVTVAVSIDGVQTPMKDTGRVETRSQTEKQPKGPAGYREVGCGTVSFYDLFGERRGTIRWARMPEKKKERLKGQLEAELQSVLRTSPGMKVVFLSDGARDHWEYFEALAKRLDLDDAYFVLDIFHALEHIKRALDAYHGELTPESKAAFEECRIWLREKPHGVDRVIRALRYRRDHRRGHRRKLIEREIRYLLHQKHRMRYAELLADDLPIGSGVVEAACKTLVTERMKRSGMSWREEGGQAILTLRSLIQSRRWERGWGMLAAEYRHDVTPVARITPVGNRLRQTG